MSRQASAFHYRDGELWCDGTALRLIAEKEGSPLYVYSSQTIIDNYQRFEAALGRARTDLFFAVKANSNLSLLKLLQQQGAGFDIVSGGELERLRRIGADLGRVLFSGVGKTADELRTAIRAGVFAINVESLAELNTLAGIASAIDTVAPISLRFNPDVAVQTHPYISTGMRNHKFGIDPSRLPDVLNLLRANSVLNLKAIGCHIGSQILDVEPFQEAFLRLKELARLLRSAGQPVRHLDLGGGFGIPYRDEVPLDLDRLGRFLESHADDYSVIVEPGRAIVGNAGALLTTVLYRKTNAEKNFVIVDAAMNDFMRPTLYSAYHEVIPLKQSQTAEVADVVGPVCETGDYFARDRQIPRLESGDRLAILNAGAYGFVLASNYNSRLRPAEVLVEDSEWRVIRRRESVDDLIGLELD